LIDYAIVNTGMIDERLCALYATENKFPVEPDLRECEKLVNKEVISGNFMMSTKVLRHDSEKIGDILINHARKFDAA
jgi:hypothetical protein